MEAPERPTPAFPRLRYKKAEPAMRELVAEALAELPPDPGLSQRANVVRLMLGMWYVSGTIRWPRGWVRQVMAGLGGRGCEVPSPSVCRWYRSALAQDPGQFASSAGVPADMLRRLELDLAGDDAASV